MTEHYVLRFFEHDVADLIPSDRGRKIGKFTRELTITRADPLFPVIASAALDASRRNVPFASWKIKRVYTDDEFATAELFRLIVTAIFEPPGEITGTHYAQRDACVMCGAGRKQISELTLDLGRVPRSADIAQTIAGETIASATFRGIVEQAALTGVQFLPVLDSVRRRRRLEGASEWSQLDVSSTVVAAESTVFGIDPLNPGEPDEFRCPEGHVAGLNVLSEVSIERESWDGSDFAKTRQLVGVSSGVLTPVPILLASPKAADAIRDAGVKGCTFEVAYLT
jgi:hypothetical protein